MSRTLKLGGRILALVGVVFAVIAVRAVVSSRSELQRGDLLRESGDLDAAMLAYRRAARWYAPANPYVPQALDRLELMANEAASAGDGERALLAWRAVRGSILSTRSFYTPHRTRLERAEQAIIEASAQAAAPRRRAQTRQRLAAAMDAPNGPLLPWSLLLLFGWITWTGGAFVFAQRAIDEEDRVRPQAARLWGTVILVGFGLFVIGMTLA